MAYKIFARRVSGGAQVSTPWAVELVAGDVEGVVLDGGGGTQLAAGVIKDARELRCGGDKIGLGALTRVTEEGDASNKYY
jgi:hypothetical protein